MKKGKALIEQDVRDALVGFLSDHIGGGVYMSDTRPRDSCSEDAVIVASAPDGSQWQRGRVRILIYVADIINYTGYPVKDIARIQAVEEMTDSIVGILNATLPEYSFDLLTAPDHSRDGESDCAEHFVWIHLQYTRQTF